MDAEPSVDAIIVLTTTENRREAEMIAARLVDERLAACVQILPSVTSVYRWQEERVTSTEHLLLIKTRRDRYERIEATIKSCHSYDTPEIVSLPTESGSRDYLAWLSSSVTDK